MSAAAIQSHLTLHAFLRRYLAFSEVCELPYFLKTLRFLYLLCGVTIHGFLSNAYKAIFGGPGAARGGGKKIRAKKSQERGEEPLGTRF